MEHRLEQKVRTHYFNNDQWLNFESLYEDDRKSNDQSVCLIDKIKEKCIFCVELRTFNYLDVGWEHQPYILFEPDYNTFIVTVPKFAYLTKQDIDKAIKQIVRENFFTCLNIKIDGNHI
jgi:hypothetical protein